MPIEQMTETGRPVNDLDIARVERRFDCKLPEAYALFLKRHNGGTPEPDAFNGLRPSDEALIHYFYSIDGDEHSDLIENAAFLREYHDVAPTMLPIARTQSGDAVCIGTADDNHGKVYFWSHDAPVREKATWLLAHDLDSFLATFHRIVL